MKAIGERVVNNVLALFGVQGATLRLRQLDGSMIGFATVGTAFSQLSNGAVLPREIGLASRAFAVGKPVWSADILHDANTLVSKEMREHIRDSGNGSIITVPLRAHENLIGTISLSDRTGRSYSQNEVALLQNFAVQVALAIQNARLYEQTQSHLKRIEALREIETAIRSTLELHSIFHLLLEKIQIFLPFPAATTIRLFNRATGKFDNIACRNIDEQEWRAGELVMVRATLSGQILKTKRPVIVPDIQADPNRAASPFYKRQYGFISYLVASPCLPSTKSSASSDSTLGRRMNSLRKKPTSCSPWRARRPSRSRTRNFTMISASLKTNWILNRSFDRSLKQLDSLYTALSPIATSESGRGELMSSIADRLMEATGADAALIRLQDNQAGNLPIVAHRGFSSAALARAAEAPPGWFCGMG